MNYVLFVLAWALTGFLGISAYVWVWSYRNSRRARFGRWQSAEIGLRVVRASCWNVHGLNASGWGLLAPLYLHWRWRQPGPRQGPS